MYISSFQITGFGLLAAVRVENLSSGINIFLGNNEAGKSTCLDFLRAMLVGLNSKGRDYNPAPGIRFGGQMKLKYLAGSGNWEELNIQRRFDPRRTVLKDASGLTVSEDILNNLLAGINREVYNNIFGFSLGELENFSKLDDDAVRNALYGASFGPGMRPAEALHSLEKTKAEIYKPQGSKLPLNRAFAELEELREKIREHSKKNEEYDKFCVELEENGKSLKNISLRRKEFESERYELEKLLNSWKQWETWRFNQARLEQIPVFTGEIPEDATAILASLREAKNSSERHLAAAAEELAQMQARLAGYTVNTRLLELALDLRRLAERKNSYRQAVLNVPAQREDCKRIQSGLEANLERLGADWSCDRIRATDRSLFANEKMEKQAGEMNEARLARQAAEDNLDRQNHEVEAAREALKAAQSVLDNLPELTAAIDGPGRDALRKDMARLEEDRRIEPGREKAVNAAKDKLERAMQQTGIQKQEGDLAQNAQKVLDNLLAHQTEAFGIAAEMKKCEEDAQHANARTVQSEEKIENLNRRIGELMSGADGSGQGRGELDSRTKALRSLRSMRESRDAEKERYNELEARLKTESAPQKLTNWFILLLGLVAICIGTVILGAIWMYGLTSYQIGDTVIPLHLFSGYIAMACGVLLIAASRPFSRKERKRQKDNIAQLLARMETSTRQIDNLEKNIAMLCVQADVDAIDDITLDAMEALIEYEKEKCFQEEQAKADIDRLEKELGLEKAKFAESNRICKKAEDDAQKCRKRWHVLMQNLQFINTPTPESATIIFARAESAQLALDNYRNLMNELADLRSDLQAIVDKISAIPAIQSKLSSALTLEQAVVQLLEECRDADLALQQRNNARTAVQNCKDTLARAQNRQRDAAIHLHTASERLNSARNNWAELLKNVGLGANLDPGTVREAFKIMDNCLVAEQQIRDKQRTLDQNEAEIETFAAPLQAICKELGLNPGKDAAGQTDWLVTLDNLLADLEKNSKYRDECENIKKLIADKEIYINSEQAALEKVSAKMRQLFDRANAKDEDDFLNMAREHAERKELLREKENLERYLSVVAEPEKLEDFLQRFRAEEHELKADRLKEINEELKSLNDQETQLRDFSVSLQAKIQNLETARELAGQRQQEFNSLENIRELSLQWARAAMAEELLKRAKSIFERERQPEVIKSASEILSRITSGRWSVGRLLDEKTSLEIFNADGDPVDHNYPSRGALEQIYLALRLAYIRNHAEHAASLPVIMDEILVNFDPERAKRTARALTYFASATGQLAQQILYFTCQPHIVDILKAVCPSAPLYVLENGQIRKAA